MYLDHKLDKAFNEELFIELAAKLSDKILFFKQGDSFYRLNCLANEARFAFKEEIIWKKENLSNPCNNLSRMHENISIRMKKQAPPPPV